MVVERIETGDQRVGAGIAAPAQMSDQFLPQERAVVGVPDLVRMCQSIDDQRDRLRAKLTHALFPGRLRQSDREGRQIDQRSRGFRMFDQLDRFAVAHLEDRLERRRDTAYQRVDAPIAQVQPKEGLCAWKVAPSGIAPRRTSASVWPPMLVAGPVFWHWLSCSFHSSLYIALHAGVCYTAVQL